MWVSMLMTEEPIRSELILSQGQRSTMTCRGSWEEPDRGEVNSHVITRNFPNSNQLHSDFDWFYLTSTQHLNQTLKECSEFDYPHFLKYLRFRMVGFESSWQCLHMSVRIWYLGCSSLTGNWMHQQLNEMENRNLRLLHKQVLIVQVMKQM